MGESNWIDSFKVNIKPNVQVDYGYVVKLNKMVEIWHFIPGIGVILFDMLMSIVDTYTSTITLELSLMRRFWIFLSWFVTTSLTGLDISTSSLTDLMFWSMVSHKWPVWFPSKEAIFVGIYCQLIPNLIESTRAQILFSHQIQNRDTEPKSKYCLEEYFNKA